MRVDAKARAKREANAAHQIPKPNVPAQGTEGRLPPPLLGLEHEQRAGHDETGAADDLGGPIRAVEGCGGGEALKDRRQGGQARDPEDGGAEELGGASDEAELVEVVVAKVVPGWEPNPGLACRAVVRAVDGLFFGELGLLAFSDEV